MIRFLFVSIILVLVFCPLLGQTPGGVAANLELWLKANEGVAGANPITAWANQSATGGANNPTINGDPQLQLGPFNYNPTIDLDGAGDFFSWDGLTDSFGNEGEIFTVLNIPTGTPTQAREIWDFNEKRPILFGTSEVGSNHPFTDGNFYDDFGCTNSPRNVTIVSFADFSATADPTRQYIYNTSSGNSSTEAYVQGLLRGVSTCSNGFQTDSDVTIGTGEFNGSLDLIASMGDIVLYDRKLNAAERTRVWSYLAVKYGITLANTGGGVIGDYRSTDNTLIWDASLSPGYHNNVIGIGRDDNEDLIQRQSQTFDDTSRVYISNLAARNEANSGVFANDNSYFMMGDNQGSVCSTPVSFTELPAGCGLFSRLEREWKVTKTNFNNDVSIDITLNNCANPGAVNINELRFLVDDDGNFSNGGTSCYFNGDGTGVVISYNNPVITISGISDIQIPNNNTVYFTIGSISPQTPLPINLIAFNVDCINQKRLLTWQTGSEKNNHYFSIEKSIDGINFEEIAQIDGAGNSQSLLTYNYQDFETNSQAVYYRLKQYDFDGRFNYSPIISSNCSLIDENITLYPNPVEDELNILISSNIDVETFIEVHDLAGNLVLSKQVMKSKAVKNEIKLNVEFLQSSMYMVTITSGSNVFRRKFLK